MIAGSRRRRCRILASLARLRPSHGETMIVAGVGQRRARQRVHRRLDADITATIAPIPAGRLGSTTATCSSHWRPLVPQHLRPFHGRAWSTACAASWGCMRSAAALQGSTRSERAGDPEGSDRRATVIGLHARHHATSRSAGSRCCLGFVSAAPRRRHDRGGILPAIVGTLYSPLLTALPRFSTDRIRASEPKSPARFGFASPTGRGPRSCSSSSASAARSIEPPHSAHYGKPSIIGRLTLPRCPWWSFRRRSAAIGPAARSLALGATKPRRSRASFCPRRRRRSHREHSGDQPRRGEVAHHVHRRGLLPFPEHLNDQFMS
jgi:hypothetical protein